MHVAPGTKANTKGVLSILFQHAMRYGLATTNPIRLVRQSVLPLQEEIVLAPCEVAALLTELRDPVHSLILLVSVTGLWRGELFGLKWQDVNFHESELRVVRSMVDQVEGPPKTLASRRPLPLSSALLETLAGWRRQSDFARPQDWVFSSPASVGKLPYWPDAVLKRHVRPAAKRAGITKTIGWHSFRRTLATLLLSSGASVKNSPGLDAAFLAADDTGGLCQGGHGRQTHRAGRRDGDVFGEQTYGCIGRKELGPLLDPRNVNVDPNSGSK